MIQRHWLIGVLIIDTKLTSTNCPLTGSRHMYTRIFQVRDQAFKAGIKHFRILCSTACGNAQTPRRYSIRLVVPLAVMHTFMLISASGLGVQKLNKPSARRRGSFAIVFPLGGTAQFISYVHLAEMHIFGAFFQAGITTENKPSYPRGGFSFASPLRGGIHYVLYLRSR